MVEAIDQFVDLSLQTVAAVIVIAMDQAEGMYRAKVNFTYNKLNCCAVPKIIT